MNLCVFQGTFNPIHKAHLKMAEYVLDNYGFEKILFIPAYKPPHKEYTPHMSLHRYNMVKLALRNNPKFDLSDIEFRNESKSYTCITIKELYRKYKIDGKINFIIGTDAFKKIESWFETDKLKELVDFIVFVRENELDESVFDNLKEKGYSFKLAPMSFYDISSTQLRGLIKNGLPINDYVTEEIRGYINEHGLYRD